MLRMITYPSLVISRRMACTGPPRVEIVVSLVEEDTRLVGRARRESGLSHLDVEIGVGSLAAHEAECPAQL